MIKGYYLNVKFLTNEKGIEKKVEMQLQCLKQNFTVKRIIIANNRPRTVKAIERLPFMGKHFGYDDALMQLVEPDFIYVRNVGFDRLSINFYKQIRKHFPMCKIIVELFSYPYDKDLFRKIYDLPILLKDRHYRRKVKGLIDRFVTYSNDNTIFGIKTIKTTNGIDVSSIGCVADISEYTETIHLTSVAIFKLHHGFDRILYGLRDYYINSKAPVNFIYNLVGDGPELQRYKKIVSEYGLENHVFFYGILEATELNEIYKKTDIAIASLGLHRIDIHYGSALKIREYLAHGLPLITSCYDPVIKNNFEYCLFVPEDDSPIDMNNIYEFFKKIAGNSSKANTYNEVRKYAYETVDNLVVMNPIVEYIKNG